MSDHRQTVQGRRRHGPFRGIVQGGYRHMRHTLHACAAWLAVFGCPLLLVVVGVSGISAMLRSHEREADDRIADARAHLMLTRAALRLTRLATWDPTFLSAQPVLPVTTPTASAAREGKRVETTGSAARDRAADADADADDSEDGADANAGAASLARVQAILSDAYRGESSLHWIALTDRDGVIRVGNDATVAGVALPAQVRAVLARSLAGCGDADAEGAMCAPVGGAATLRAATSVSANDRPPPGWNLTYADVHFLGEPVRNARGQIVAYVVIGIDTPRIRRERESAARLAAGGETDGRTAVAPTPRVSSSAAAVSLSHAARWLGGVAVLALLASVLSYRRARRRPLLARRWREGWRAARRRRGMLARTLAQLQGASAVKEDADAAC